MSDHRKIFDSIPDEFDKYRFRYCAELFAGLIEYAELSSGKSVLEIGPGTGQATEPILKTGCDYRAIELGENFTAVLKNKYGGYGNFRVDNADFETFDYGRNLFDLVYSAAAFQWIPEHVGYPKAYGILKSGGAFAMFYNKADYRTPNPALYEKIQEAYSRYFHPEAPYTCQLDYEACGKYGFVNLERREYNSERTLTAAEYVALAGTHADHLSLKGPNKSRLYDGIRDAINSVGGRITLLDTTVMYLAKKTE